MLGNSSNNEDVSNSFNQTCNGSTQLRCSGFKNRSYTVHRASIELTEEGPTEKLSKGKALAVTIDINRNDGFCNAENWEANPFRTEFDSSGLSGNRCRRRHLLSTQLESGDTKTVYNTYENSVEENYDNENLNSISDFDVIHLRKLKEKRYNKRKRNDVDLVNDNDDLIEQLIVDMRIASDEDRLLNQKGEPATKKIAMLKHVMSQLIKKDLQLLFVEHNILHVLTEWLAPLPTKCLPHWQIRERILKVLLDFPAFDKSYLKESGIGKVIMYLQKHPQETKANRGMAGRLITKWARPIYNISCEFSDLSKEERQKRDLKQISRLNHKRSETAKATIKKTTEIEMTNKDVLIENNTLRARRPELPNREYVIRPKSKIEEEFCLPKKRKLDRYELQAKKYINAKRITEAKSAMNLSLNGSKLL